MRNDSTPRPIGRRPAREGRKTFWLLVLASTVLAVLGVAHTWTRVAVLERKYQLASATAENERLTNELNQLDLEVATYESTNKIDEAARTLSMVKPVPNEVRVVPPLFATELAGEGPLPSRTLAVNEGGR